MTAYLISTSQAFIAADDTLQTYKIIHRGSGIYYGISYNDEFVYVAARNNNDAINGDSARTTVLVFCTETLQLRHTEEFAEGVVRDVHQIFLRGKSLTLTSTGDNAIVELTADGTHFSHLRKFWPIPETPKFTDTKHINSVVCYDEVTTFLCAHCHGASELWAINHSCKTAEKIATLGRTAHNVWVQQHEYLLLDSHSGYLRGSCGTNIAIGHDWLRGIVISATTGIATIGASSVVERARRNLSDSKILRRNPSGSITKFRLDGLGQILEIRQPGVIDYCHPTDATKPILYENLPGIPRPLSASSQASTQLLDFTDSVARRRPECT